MSRKQNKKKPSRYQKYKKSINAACKRHYDKNKETILGKTRAKYAENPEPFKAKSAKSRAKNPQKSRDQSKEWYHAHKEHRAAYVEANRTKINAQARLKRARAKLEKLGDTPYRTVEEERKIEKAIVKVRQQIIEDEKLLESASSGTR